MGGAERPSGRCGARTTPLSTLALTGTLDEKKLAEAAAPPQPAHGPTSTGPDLAAARTTLAGEFDRELGRRRRRDPRLLAAELYRARRSDRGGPLSLMNPESSAEQVIASGQPELVPRVAAPR